MKLSRKIKIVEDRQKKGKYGAWRRELIGKVLPLSEALRKASYEELIQELKPRGEYISCAKGCTYCCYQHVHIHAGWGLIITDYLYSNKTVLNQFISNYENWKQSVGKLSDEIDIIRAEALKTAQTPEDPYLVSQHLTNKYYDRQVPCPFLIKAECSIYPVRPLICSFGYSSSPPEWCSNSNPNAPNIYQYFPEESEERKLSMLFPGKFTMLELSLPTMVYRLLTEGHSIVTR